MGTNIASAMGEMMSDKTLNGKSQLSVEDTEVKVAEESDNTRSFMHVLGLESEIVQNVFSGVLAHPKVQCTSLCAPTGLEAIGLPFTP